MQRSRPPAVAFLVLLAYCGNGCRQPAQPLSVDPFLPPQTISPPPTGSAVPSARTAPYDSTPYGGSSVPEGSDSRGIPPNTTSSVDEYPTRQVAGSRYRLISERTTLDSDETGGQYAANSRPPDTEAEFSDPDEGSQIPTAWPDDEDVASTVAAEIYADEMEPGPEEYAEEPALSEETAWSDREWEVEEVESNPPRRLARQQTTVALRQQALDDRQERPMETARATVNTTGQEFRAYDEPEEASVAAAVYFAAAESDDSPVAGDDDTSHKRRSPPPARVAITQPERRRSTLTSENSDRRGRSTIQTVSYEAEVPRETVAVARERSTASSWRTSGAAEVRPAIDVPSSSVARAETRESSSQRYDFLRDYSTLRGRLEYSEIRDQWKLRYIPIDGKTDEFGGSVVLGDKDLLESYEPGDYVVVEGRMGNTRSRSGLGYAPKYDVSRIHRQGRS